MLVPSPRDLIQEHLMSGTVIKQCDGKTMAALGRRAARCVAKKDGMTILISRRTFFENVGEFEATFRNHHIKVVIRDAKLRDYCKHAAVGAVLGAGTSAWWLILFKGGLSLALSSVGAFLAVGAVLG